MQAFVPPTCWQTRPQAPQFIGVLIAVSQPSVGSLLQSAVLGAQAGQAPQSSGHVPQFSPIADEQTLSPQTSVRSRAGCAKS